VTFGQILQQLIRTAKSGQTLSYLVTTSSSALFATPRAVNAAGTLTFKPKLGASGTAVISVRIKDGGLGGAPSVNTSAAQTFTINITNAP